MSANYEQAWTDFKQMTELSIMALLEMQYKKDPNLKDGDTQLMMLQKILYSIDDIERKNDIQSSRIIKP